MKRTVVVVVLALLLLAAPAALAKSTLTVNPLGLLIGAISVEYETELDMLPDSMTLVVPGLYWGFDLNPDVDLKLSAMGIGAGARYYIDGVAHDGLYVGGYASFASLSGKSGGNDFTGSAFGVNGEVGYKWIFDNDFVVDVSAGIGFPVSSSTTGADVEADQIGGAYGTTLGVGLGLAF